MKLVPAYSFLVFCMLYNFLAQFYIYENAMKLQWKTLLVYLDDVIIFSKDFESYLERLEEVLLRFEEANLKLKAKKCNSFAKEVSYLGQIVSGEGISTDPT